MNPVGKLAQSFTILFLMLVLPVIVDMSLICRTMARADQQTAVKAALFDTGIPIIVEAAPRRLSFHDTMVIRLIGRVEPGNHLYSVKKQGKYAPEPTEIIMTTPWLEAVDKTDESKTERVIDPAFDMSLAVHHHDFWFSRRYRLTSKAPTGRQWIRGYLRYQICSGRICSLPLKSHFSEQIMIVP